MAIAPRPAKKAQMPTSSSPTKSRKITPIASFCLALSELNPVSHVHEVANQRQQDHPADHFESTAQKLQSD
jgi:hypothetical protein